MRKLPLALHRPLTAAEQERLDECFDYHPPDGDKGERHAEVRKAMKEAGRRILEVCPPGCRETAAALARLQEAMMWANAAIARSPLPF